MIEKICDEIGITPEQIIIEKLQQKNKILKENAENNDKVVDKVNWENQQLKNNINKLQKELNEENLQCSKYSIELNNLKEENKKLNGAIQTYDILLKSNVEENKQLKDNWNKLKEYIKETKLKEFEKSYGKRFGKTFIQAEIIVCNMILDKMKELEQGSDSNE